MCEKQIVVQHTRGVKKKKQMGNDRHFIIVEFELFLTLD